MHGRFLVTVDGDRLHALLTAAGVAGSSIDADRELWERVVQAAAVATAEAAVPSLTSSGSPDSGLAGSGAENLTTRILVGARLRSS